MADQTPEARLVAALNLVGIDQNTWDGTATKEAKSALFNTEKDKKLAELKNKLDAASTNEAKKPIQDNIDLLNLASEDLSTPDEEKDTKNNEEPPPIEPKKNNSDSGAKSWYDIMMELMEGPKLDNYKDAGKKMEAICNHLRSFMPKTTPKEIEDAQRELYFADDKAGLVNKEWIEKNGTMGNKIEDAIIKNEWRKAALVKEHAIETQRQETLIEENIAFQQDVKEEKKREVIQEANEEIQKGMTPTEKTLAHQKAETAEKAETATAEPQKTPEEDKADNILAKKVLETIMEKGDIKRSLKELKDNLRLTPDQDKQFNIQQLLKTAMTEQLKKSGASKTLRQRKQTNAKADRSTPSGENSRSNQDNSKPAGSDEKPAGDRSKTSGSSSKPTGDSSKPSGSSSKPNGNSSKPSGSSSKPAGDRSKPSSRSSSNQSGYINGEMKRNFARETLKLKPNPTKAQIMKAYKSEALARHPDKVADKSEEGQLRAPEDFQNVNNAKDKLIKDLKYRVKDSNTTKNTQSGRTTKSPTPNMNPATNTSMKPDINAAAKAADEKRKKEEQAKKSAEEEKARKEKSERSAPGEEADKSSPTPSPGTGID